MILTFLFQIKEVSENVKYIVVTSRASKIPVLKVQLLRDLNPGLPREPIGNFETLEVTAMYFTFLETSSLFLYGLERSRI